MAEAPKVFDLETMAGAEAEPALKNHSRTITWEFDLDEEAIKKAAAEHLAELQKQPVTPEELGAFIKRVQSTGLIKNGAGFYGVRIEPTNAVFVTGGNGGDAIKLEVYANGKQAWRDLTPDEARHIAALLLAAAGEA